MRVRGHLVEIDWDGSVLAARATNAEGREFLASTTDDGRLELAVDEIDEVGFRDAPRMIGGVLVVVDTAGHEPRMHFRRPSREAFHQVYDELEVALREHRAEVPVIDLTESAAEVEQTQDPAYDESVSV